MKFTTTTLRSLALPRGLREKTFFDDDLPGFGVRIRAGGSRTWVVQYKRGVKHRRMPLGAVAALDLGKARATAKDLLAKVRLGQDPAAEKLEQRQKMAETFGAILPRFLARQRARLKPRSYEETERHLVTHARTLHTRGVENIDRRTVALLLSDIAEKSGPSAANRVRASLSAFCMWLVREGILQSNPVAFTNRAIEGGPRDRFLADDELVAIWRALDDGQYGAIVKLLILSGARRDEIASLRWSEIDLDNAAITLLPERTKNRRVHEICLSPAALSVLQAQSRRLQADGSTRDLVFGYGDRGWQNWSGSKKELDVRAKIADWRLHDIRRTISTAMHERLGVMPHVVEAVLGHIDGHRAGVAGVYNKSSYSDQKRIALMKWADHVETLVSGKCSAAVVKLRRFK